MARFAYDASVRVLRAAIGRGSARPIPHWTWVGLSVIHFEQSPNREEFNAMK